VLIRKGFLDFAGRWRKGLWWPGKEPKFIEHHTEHQSQIRGYQKFKRTHQEMGA
jgi:hypothetical protein